MTKPYAVLDKLNPFPVGASLLPFMFPFAAPSNTQNGWLDGWFSPRITLSAAGDPALETVLANGVMSYGRQLGILMDAVVVLAKHADRKGMSKAEIETIDRVAEVAKAFDAVKKIRKP